MRELNLDLNENDVNAICTALDLLVSLNLEKTEKQSQINAQLAYFASIKLQNNSPQLTANEARIVYAAVSCAKLILAGAYSVETEKKKELAPYIFNYNRLERQLQVLDDMLL